jgi:hypothetical protein
MVRMAKSPTKIRVYGSKRMTDRNVGVQIARKRGGVIVVCSETPCVVTGGTYPKFTNLRIMFAGLKD